MTSRQTVVVGSILGLILASGNVVFAQESDSKKDFKEYREDRRENCQEAYRRMKRESSGAKRE